MDRPTTECLFVSRDVLHRAILPDGPDHVFWPTSWNDRLFGFWFAAWRGITREIESRRNKLDVVNELLLVVVSSTLYTVLVFT